MMFKELGGMMNLLGNKGRIQEEMQKFQQTVAGLNAEGAAGGGLVHVKVGGQFNVLNVSISPEAMKLNDKEMLEDLIAAATNAGMAKVRELIAAETAKMAGSLGLPPGMLGGLGSAFPGL
jgi:DNA-binding YbaB/EbfC family protein